MNIGREGQFLKHDPGHCQNPDCMNMTSSREGEAVGVRLTANLADGQLAVKFKMKAMTMITTLTW